MSAKAEPAGHFVEDVEATLGLGRLVEVSALLGAVDYFDHPGPGGTVRRETPLRDLRRATLAPQTRVHAELDGEWRHGRVIQHETGVGRVHVRLEGGKERILLEQDVRVRWRRRLADASHLLAAISVESRRFYDGRAGFVNTYIARSAAYQGMTALASASIELHPHQLEAVRKVLEDDTQRYLLADEVGLGKTIEAAVLIRQHLLDGSPGEVVVLVPPTLVSQWTSELNSKFRIEEQFPGRVHVRPFTWLDRPEPLEASFLVVDEVHGLAGETSPTAAGGPRYEALRAASLLANKLILLSATPLLQEPASLLRILHLLAPNAHPLEDLDGFERALKARDEIGTLYANLHAEAQPSFVRVAIEGLREILAGDPYAEEALANVEASLDGSPPDSLSATVRRARAYIGEGHRLYSRMVRTRRANGLAEEFPVLGRVTPSRLAVGVTLDVEAALRSWREHVAVLLAVEPSGRLPLLAAARDLLEAASAAGDQLGDAARARVADKSVNGPDEAEREILEDLADASCRRAPVCPRIIAASDAAIECVVRGDRVAVAAGTERVADRIVAAIDARLPGAALRLSADTPDAVGRFSTSTQGSILVFGPSGEEGQNLQAANVVIHTDLPWSPNRIEQRLGRFDRFGPGETARQVVVVDGGRTTGDAWLDVLVDGFGIFRGSVASLQLVIDSLMPPVLDAAIAGGPEGMRATARQVAIALEEELERIELAELIDETAVDEVGFRLMQETEAADSPGGSEPWAAAAVRWAAGDGSGSSDLRFHHSSEGARHRFGLTPYERPDVARLDLRDLPLIPLDDLDRRFAGSLDGYGNADGTFRRNTAAARAIRLLGPGDPFIEALWTFTEEDDRGRSFATWRRRESWTGRDDLLAFCFEFRVRPDVSAGSSFIESLGHQDVHAPLKRRAETYLPAFQDRVWVDHRGAELEDPTTIARLDEPFSELRGDVTLRPWLWHRVDDLVPRDKWSETCLGLRDRALDVLRARRSLTSACVNASTQLLADGEDAAARTRARRDVDAAVRAAQSLDLTRCLAEGARSPLIEVDVAGIVILSAEGIPADERRN